MSKQEAPVSLSDKNIWIVDDDIPIEILEFDNEALLDGRCPIDRGVLSHLSLSDEGWNDKAVFELCKELLETNNEIKAFLLPTGALDYLRKGALPPDVIIFDMNYRNIPDNAKVISLLESILKRCISVIQIYTKESLQEIDLELAPLTRRYSSRLQPPRLKHETHADQLESIISGKLSTSLSSQLATNIRRLSTTAIENVLVRLDDLPVDIAVSLLTGGSSNINDEEFIELLSSKCSSILGSSKEFTNAIIDYAKKANIPEEKGRAFVDEVVQLFVRSVRTNIQNDKWLYDAIKSVGQKPRVTGLDDATLNTIIQDFSVYRLYDRPDDNIVRTGDIISLSETEKTIPDLIVVITPPCDLNRFWKKTRGVLTYAKMHPLTTDIGIPILRAYNNSDTKKPSSVTSTVNPFIFPLIPVTDETRVDYALFIYEVQNIELDGHKLWKPDSGILERDYYDSPLTYTEMNELFYAKRCCRISEPFLSGILSGLKDHIFRTGIPDFPDQEKDRLHLAITAKCKA